MRRSNFKWIKFQKIVQQKVKIRYILDKLHQYMLSMMIKKLVTMMTLSLMLSAVFVLQIGFPVLAAENDGSAVIQTGFNTIYSLIAAIVSSIGSLYLLWGVFEWAQSMNSQDGGAQSMAFKRIAGGLVAVITPQLIPVITSSVGA